MTKENQKLKIGILGKEKEIIFFRALGFEIFPVDDGLEKAIESIEKRKDLAIIFVPYHIFSKIKMEKLEKFYQKKYPVFVSLPFKGEKKEAPELKEISKMAIGKEKI